MEDEGRERWASEQEVCVIEREREWKSVRNIKVCGIYILHLPQIFPNRLLKPSIILFQHSLQVLQLGGSVGPRYGTKIAPRPTNRAHHLCVGCIAEIHRDIELRLRTSAMVETGVSFSTRGSTSISERGLSLSKNC